tara:strand:+ start:248 stop:484 length:237 start_codon:yes stop_codon:yes gene_type:complete
MMIIADPQTDLKFDVAHEWLFDNYPNGFEIVYVNGKMVFALTDRYILKDVAANKFLLIHDNVFYWPYLRFPERRAIAS